MKARQLISLIVSVSMLFVLGTAALAQTVTPDVQVAGTGIVDGSVTIVQATVVGPGWVVIHADADGTPGPVIGHAPLTDGVNENVVVTIDMEAATPILHAMLHVDAGTVGVYEFPGPDAPVKIGDAIVMARFSASPVIPDAVPTTGASTSTPLIFAATATVLLALSVSVVITRRRDA